MKRRTFLYGGLGAMFVGANAVRTISAAPQDLAVDGRHDEAVETATSLPHVRGLIPVVGDGKWIWTKPPKSTGYQEPRDFSLSIGIEMRGRGPATQIKATTAVPVEHPEQKIKEGEIDTHGCRATLRQLSHTAGQLMLGTGSIVGGQVIRAVARFRLTLMKDYRGFERDQFPDVQEYSKEFLKQYLYDSPGIQTRDKRVKDLAKEVAGKATHPWEKAHHFYQWVWKYIKPRIQYYTSVIAAIRDRVGDCEERAAVFIALCRASGIPARLVWVPGHNWAEFALTDYRGKGVWIPAHTSAYSWFGWTGAHEIVLQKGDSIRVPEKRKTQRLMADWMQWKGKRPLVRYFAEIQPLLAAIESDPGPGARRKVEKGEWKAVGRYAREKYTRQ